MASAGSQFRAALAAESPLQVMGAITAYAGLMARRTGYKALYLSGGGVAANSLLRQRFAEAATDPKVTANPLFAPLHQPGVGEYLAPGLPFSIDGARIPAVPSPALGDDTAAVLAERLGTSAAELGRLRETGTVATGSGDS